jgi:LmbE family N-acetylglucosaminyl deacetylase
MHPLSLLQDKSQPLNVLCLGAHSDDIEIGCGATLLRLQEEYPAIHIDWVVFSGDEKRAKEARTSAGRFLRKAKSKNIITKAFRDGFFPYCGAEIKDAFEELKRTSAPQLVFTHYRHDLHQDHRLLSELSRNTWRSHLILEYEIMKYDGDLGVPNVFVPVTEKQLEAKIKILLECFPTQASKHWFDRETFRALPRLRGMECNAPTRFAEAFHGHKVRLF